MEWYWWVLVAIAVVVIGYVKIVVGSKWLASRKAKKAAEEALLDD